MKQPYTILIVEDELIIAEMLKEMLVELDYSVVGIAKNYSEAKSYLENTENIDLAILDINLEEEKRGTDIGLLINEKYDFPFVYLTSYSDPTTMNNAIQTLPSSYLIKPFTKEDIYTTIELLKARKKQTNKFIIIKDGHLNVKIYSKDIISINSQKNYVEIVTKEKKHIQRSSTESFLEELNDSNFVRIHRSYVINITKVNAVNGQYIIIEGEKYPLSRKYRDEVIKHFNK